MSEAIAAAFATARSENRAALMPYMMSGFPDREISAAVAASYADAGADLVELGVPYSDPLADGPVIHAAGTRALAAGATLESVLADCESIASRLASWLALDGGERGRVGADLRGTVERLWSWRQVALAVLDAAAGRLQHLDHPGED